MGSRARSGHPGAGRPKVLAHRGASARAPENTTAAFDLAISMRADGIETDLRITRDEVVVLFHDATVDRSTDGHGHLDGLTFPELQALDAGRWFHPRFAGLRVPDLASFLRRYAGRVDLELELKVSGATVPALDTVRRGEAAAWVTFTSFHYPILEAVRRRAAWARIGWVVERVTPEAVAAVCALAGVQICPWAGGLTKDDVSLAHRSGLQVRAWGIADPIDARRVIACGADGATVNTPEWLDGTHQHRPTRTKEEVT